jgi:thioredoxin 1
MSNILEVTDTTFEKLVLKSKIPVLVDFWAISCRPCQLLAPVLDELAGEYDGKLTIAKLDIDDNQQTALKYHIMSKPTMIIFKEGKPSASIFGFKPKAQLKKDLDAALA